MCCTSGHPTAYVSIATQMCRFISLPVYIECAAQLIANPCVSTLVDATPMLNRSRVSEELILKQRGGIKFQVGKMRGERRRTTSK
jgi:hypothetical protein